jgi:hypothetical protein
MPRCLWLPRHSAPFLSRRRSRYGRELISNMHGLSSAYNLPLSGACAYLTAELARRHDWARLWELALGLPLSETVAARQLPGDWQPAGEAAWRLRRLLSAARPAEITAVSAPDVNGETVPAWPP